MKSEVEITTLYLSENIRYLRLEKGITQETLAEFLGVTFQSVSRWERGEGYPDITMLPVIASLCHITKTITISRRGSLNHGNGELEN